MAATATDDPARHKEKMVNRKAIQDAEVAEKTIEKGLLIVHTGKGKGKSTAAWGLLLRALGRGFKVGVVQFGKGAWNLYKALKTVCEIIAAPEITIKKLLKTWFLDDDPALLEHERFLDLFGSDEIVVAGLEAPDVFAPGMLARIDRLTRAIERAPHVEKVFSLTNIEAI